MVSAPAIVVADADVIIHFLNVRRLDLLRAFSEGVLVTEHVRKEVTIRSLADERAFEEGLALGAFEEIVVTGPSELSLFARLQSSGRLGQGECSAIAASIHRGHDLAMNDRVASRAARDVSPDLRIHRTQDIVVSLIRGRVLTVPEADVLLESWAENHRFRIPITSFGDLLG